MFAIRCTSAAAAANPPEECFCDDDAAIEPSSMSRADDGGETIELMINQNRPIAQYYREWTPIHEFSHLMLPYLDREQRWVSEGFAQYYQNVFLARADQHSARDAWQKIYDGLERGRDQVACAVIDADQRLVLARCDRANRLGEGKVPDARAVAL